MDIEKLKQIEKSPEIKQKYLSTGTWGMNNVMYVPVLLIVASFIWLAMFLYFRADMGMSSQATMINVGVSLAVASIGYLWLRYVKKGLLRKGMVQLDDYPVCLAKIVMGNDDSYLYYCIYTTGAKRFDIDWLNHIYYKIWHTEEEPNVRLRKKVDDIFKIEMLATVSQNSFLLPEEFTEGEKVYKKFYGFQRDRALSIQQDDGFFPVIYFNPISVPVLQQEDYKDLLKGTQDIKNDS
jgi:hypothetical protein